MEALLLRCPAGIFFSRSDLVRPLAPAAVRYSTNFAAFHSCAIPQVLTRADGRRNSAIVACVSSASISSSGPNLLPDAYEISGCNKSEGPRLALGPLDGKGGA